MVTLAEAYAAEGLAPPSSRSGPKSEHILQTACSQWLKEALPPAVVWTAIDHGSYFGGGKQSGMRAWARLKARGVKTGIPDLHFWWHGIYLAVEMKTSRGNTDGQQDEWIASLRREGFLAGVARSVGELEGLLRGAGFPVRASSKGIDERLPLREKAAGKTRPSSKSRVTPPAAGLRAVARARAKGTFV